MTHSADGIGRNPPPGCPFHTPPAEGSAKPDGAATSGPTMNRPGVATVDAIQTATIGSPRLQEGGFEGKSKQVNGDQDRMVLQIKKDPENPQGFYASLSEYTRRLPALLGRLVPGLQMTSWIPRGYPYYLEHKGNDVYDVKILRVAKDGSLEVDPDAPVSKLELGKKGMRGAVMTRTDADGSQERIKFKGGKSFTTWERKIDGDFFLAIDTSGRQYFEKGVNTKVKDGVITLDTDHMGGKYKLVPHAGGLFHTMVPLASRQLGSKEVQRKIVVGKDIVNWKPFRTTIEILFFDPKDASRVDFFYERHDRDPTFSIGNLLSLVTRRFRREAPLTREQLIAKS
ncbi:MAG: hypothetical protein AAF658_08295 [Myxococcota bacterium]